MLLAAQAAVAIENARLYEATTQLVEPARVAERGRQRARDRDRPRARCSTSSRGACASCSTPGWSRCCCPPGATSCGSPRVAGEARHGSRRPDDSGRTASKSGRVLERGRSERSDSVLDDPEVDRDVVRRLRRAHRALGAARSRAGATIGSSRRTTSSAPTRASPTTTSGWRRRSPRAPRSPSTSRSGSRATRSAASSTRRSSSAAGSRASCTTRRARR